MVTDASLRTSDPAIYAAGDVANEFHPLLGTHIRVEHWANALHQPQTSAAAMLGKDASYDRVPYFYTDQYDLGMEYAGYAGPGGYDQVIFRGDAGKREFIVFWLSRGRVAALVSALGAVAVSVEYRLAPRHMFPAAVEDAYAAARWTHQNAEELGIDPGRLIVMGTSAGGGLAAATVLMSRDRQGPPIQGAMLLYPMLDDREAGAPSVHQAPLATWTREDNRTAWAAYLGNAAGRPGVSPYAAPARADNLRGFPPTYLTVGSADIYRSHVTRFAARLADAGAAVDARVYAGAPHGYDQPRFEDSAASRECRQARVRWLARTMRLRRQAAW